MNEKKICFIICTNDKAKYNKCLQHINRIKVPLNYTKEILPIVDAKSMASGYNLAMRKSDAKYKIYLHQDVYVINTNILFDALKLFKRYSKLGIIGIAGAKLLPTNCVWGAGAQQYGRVYHYLEENNEIWLSNYGKNTKIQGDYESVEAVDGLLMITQYDITWREDIFDGWHYYDLSQCLEFIKAGYEVGIPNASNVWCIHNAHNNLTGYKEAQKNFINEYKDFLKL